MNQIGQIFKLIYKTKLQLIIMSHMFTNQNCTSSLRNAAPKHSSMMISNNFEPEMSCMVTPKKLRIFNGYEPMEIETNLKEYPEIESNFRKIDQNVSFIPWKNSMVEFRKMEHVRINRARLYDWFVEVCKVYNQAWQTLWMAISILDKMIIEKGNIKVENIHLYGTAALFISSKYNESYNYITIQSLLANITHGKFTKKQVLDSQGQIFIWICLSNNNKSLHFPTMQDRLVQWYPQLCKEDLKKIMIELFYFWQDPILLNFQESDMTEKELVRRVAEAVLNGERFEDCEKVEKMFLLEYGCCNITRYGRELNL